MLRGPALHMRLLVLIILNNRIEQQHSVDDVPPGLGRSDVHLAAEDRMSELDEMRSEGSAIAPRRTATLRWTACVAR